MAEKYETKVHQPKSVLYEEWNAIVLVVKRKGTLLTFDSCINSEAIANILSIPKP